MTGIREMFQEYSGEDVDWFQLAFVFEERVRQRNERQRYHDWLRGPKPTRREKCREYQRKYEAKPSAIEMRRARQRAYWHRKKLRAA
jgi:hypothetical protein